MESNGFRGARNRQYCYFVDGEWRDDPDFRASVRNPFGTENDVIQIGAAKGKEQAEVKAAACNAERAVAGQINKPRHFLRY